MGGRGLSVPPPARSPPVSPSLALPPSMRRRREGELPGVLRGELLAVLQEEKSQVRRYRRRDQTVIWHFSAVVQQSFRSARSCTRKCQSGQGLSTIDKTSIDLPLTDSG